MGLRVFADGALFVDTVGSGPPRVLALHGWGRRGNDFRASLTGLGALAPDLPGFGASPPPTDVLGATGYALIVGETLSEFSRPPVVVGHSFGGRVAVCLAVLFPELVGPLVLTGAPLVRVSSPKKPGLGYRMVRVLNEIGLVSDHLLEDLRQKRGSADYRAARGIMRDVLVKTVNESYENALGVIRQPVHMLWGDQDREVPLAAARVAVQLVREGGGEAELEVVEGVGHLLPVEAPDRLRDAVDRALVR